MRAFFWCCPRRPGQPLLGNLRHHREHFSDELTVAWRCAGAVRFTARAEPQCQLFVPQNSVNLVFDPQPGTHSQLSQTTLGTVRLIDGNLADPGAAGEPIDPSGYRLTTAEGIVYDIDQHVGLKRLEEPNGNALTFTTHGVTHSSGVAVTFERDTLGRITKMILPDQTERTYGYDANGDLETATDPVDQVSSYTYAQPAHPHYLKDIRDPRTIRVSRSEYDAAGRLVKLIDADNYETVFDRKRRLSAVLAKPTHPRDATVADCRRSALSTVVA